MRKLLRANLMRLRRSRAFWICLAGCLLFGGFMLMSEYNEMANYGLEVRIDDIFLSLIAMIGIAAAAFVTMYVGTDYSDGTIRNKIIIGHRRKDIYLANFLTCAFGNLVFYLAYLVVVCAVGIPIFGSFMTKPSVLALWLLDAVLLILVYAALFNLLSMLCANKAVAAVVSLVLIFGFLMLASGLLNLLSQPEMIEQATSVDGEFLIETVKNPAYPTEGERKLLQFLVDFIPTGQGFQIVGQEIVHPVTMALYSIGIIIVANGVGIWRFGKKDLK
ncbi:MAG TPA: ABC transporter permease [Candidatus Dorea gallistercoris]|uniref:ABC transporter permease n=1 Tax=Candidatus Dorea gallistercoris TaxID=2838542 RepID=A0A9D1UDK7_9FIRM|nr:ABC transporter permease [Candidatus Dorea gallistercoris]